jgi:Flp pilus assembly protein TadG
MKEDLSVMAHLKHKSFASNEEGAAILIIAISFLVLVVFSVMAVDFTRVFLVRSQVQYATDSATIGAADIATPSLFKSDPQAIQRRAREFFYANYPENYLGSTVNFKNGDIVTYNPETGVVDSAVSVNIPLTFGTIYELNAKQSDYAGDTPKSIDTGTISQVVSALDQGSIEIALAVDISNSMCNQLETGLSWGKDAVRDSKCDKFNAVKRTINNTIITQVEQIVEASAVDRASGGGVYFSLIPFTHDVRFNSSNENFEFVNGAKVPGDEINAVGLRGKEPASYNELRDRVSKLTPLEQGGTNTAIGLWHAWASLSPDKNGLFKDHEDVALHPSPYGNIQNLTLAKVVVLLTDGENAYTNYNQAGFSISGDAGTKKDITGATGVHFDTRIDAQFATICQNMRDAGIIVNTYGYDIKCDSTIATLLSNCAGDKGQYRCVKNENELKLAFDDLIRNLIDLRITQ